MRAAGEVCCDWPALMELLLLSPGRVSNSNSDSIIPLPQIPPLLLPPFSTNLSRPPSFQLFLLYRRLQTIPSSPIPRHCATSAFVSPLGIFPSHHILDTSYCPISPPGSSQTSSCGPCALPIAISSSRMTARVPGSPNPP